MDSFLAHHANEMVKFTLVSILGVWAVVFAAACAVFVGVWTNAGELGSLMGLLGLEGLVLETLEAPSSGE